MRKQDRENWQGLLLAGLRRSEVDAASYQPPMPAQLTIRVWGCRMDPDNVAAAHKYAIDALVSIGLLVDDSAKYVRRVVAELPTDRPEWLPRGEGFEIEIRGAA